MNSSSESGIITASALEVHGPVGAAMSCSPAPDLGFFPLASWFRGVSLFSLPTDIDSLLRAGDDVFGHFGKGCDPRVGDPAVRAACSPLAAPGKECFKPVT